MRSPGLRIALLFVLAVGACRSADPPAAPAAREAPAVSYVTSSGVVEHLTARGRERAQKAGRLSPGEAMVTGPDGTVVLRLPDGRELEVKPGSRLRLARATDGQVEVEIEMGSITARLGSAGAGPPVSVAFLTPFGLTRVPAAAGESAVTVRSDGVSVVVAMGEVAFVDRSGKEVRARGGERIEVRAGEIALLPATSSASGLPAAPHAQKSEPSSFTISAGRGTVLLRRPGAKSFGPESDSPVPPGTVYRVPVRENRARLRAPGLRARLLPGSEGRVGSAGRGDHGHHYQLDLDGGAALVQLEDGDAPREVRLALAGETVTVRARASAALKLARRGDSLGLTSYVGGLEIAFGKERRQMREGERLELSGRGILARPRRAVEVALPTAGDLRVHADALEEVKLTWPPELGGARVEVATDPDFKDVLVAGRPEEPALVVPAPRRGDLYWRILAAGDGAAKPLLGHARFLPDGGRTVLDLANPRNLVAETGEVTTVYFQSVLPALTFSFAAKPGARAYRLRVYRVGDLKRPVVERRVAELRCALAGGTLAEGSYLWHAVALDERGREVGGGLLNKLELVYDNALSTLAIGSPRPGARVRGPHIDVSGLAPLGSKLFVNGRPAPLDDKGRFEMRIERRAAVVFRLLDNRGGERYWVRTVQPAGAPS